MPQIRLAVGGEADAGIPAEQRAVGLDLILVQNLQGAVQAVEVDHAGGRGPDGLIQRLLGIVHDVADLQDVDLRALRQAAVEGDAAVLDLVEGAHEDLLTGHDAQGLHTK